MKYIFLFFTIAFSLSLLTGCGSSNHLAVNPIIGVWEFVDGSENGSSNRFLTFKDSGEFETYVLTDCGKRRYNSGLYAMLDDSTLVTVHTDEMGDRYNVSNHYNVTIIDGVLSFSGFYVNPVTRTSFTRVSWISEDWRKFD